MSTTDVIHVNEGESAVWQTGVDDKGTFFLMDTREVQVVQPGTGDDEAIHGCARNRLAKPFHLCSGGSLDSPLDGQVADAAQETGEKGIGREVVALLTKDGAYATGLATG